MENHSRSLMKSITFRIMATSTTILLVFVFTSNLTTSLGVGAVEIILKTAIYYLHERIWSKLKYGLKENPS